jgi:DNA-directed RNA polymerase subunit RPC12/RpoP
MGMKGKRKYECGSCSHVAFYHWINLNRAGGLKCENCGSRNMELVTEEAKQASAEAQSVRVLGGTRSTTNPKDGPKKKIV